MIRLIITNLKSKKNNGTLLRECDYKLMLSVLLPFYFKWEDNWCILPDFTGSGGNTPDYLVVKINTDNGEGIAHLLVQLKNEGDISWEEFIENELWKKSNSFKNNKSEQWVMALIGFEICIFKFDINAYFSSSTKYTNFSPLNLNNFTKNELDNLGIKYDTEIYNNKEIIRVIKWRLDDSNHVSYIHEMLTHISKYQI